MCVKQPWKCLLASCSQRRIVRSPFCTHLAPSPSDTKTPKGIIWKHWKQLVCVSSLTMIHHYFPWRREHLHFVSLEILRFHISQSSCPHFLTNTLSIELQERFRKRQTTWRCGMLEHTTPGCVWRNCSSIALVSNRPALALGINHSKMRWEAWRFVPLRNSFKHVQENPIYLRVP